MMRAWHSKIDGKDASRGSALVLTLLVIATLSGIAIAFADSSRTEVSLAAYYRDGFRARALARAGYETALWELYVDEDLEVDGPDETWSLFDGTTLPLELDDGSTLKATITDESSKINVNMLFNESGEIDTTRAEQVMRLLQILELEDFAYESLLDWLDKDDIKRMDGAESYHYMGLETPYECANGPFLTTDQIRLVQGFETADILRFITIHSDGKINVNTAPAEVLQSLDPGMDESIVEDIIARRIEEPFKAVADVQEAAGMDGELFQRIQGFLSVKSSTFSITLDAVCGDVNSIVRAVVTRNKEKAPVLLYWQMV